MNYSTVKIPVNAVTKKYFEKRYFKKMNARGYMQLDKNTSFGMKIIHYLDSWHDWKLPIVDGIHLKIKLPATYMMYGIKQRKLEELGKLLDSEAMEYLTCEIACAATFPGISVTDAIITVMGRFDISDDEYRTDSMRKHFDRYCGDVLGETFKDFSFKINLSIKNLYEKMVRKFLTFEEITH